MSRVNHSCDPNAYHYHEKDTGTNLLLSSKPIKQGEEIFINYFDFSDISTTNTSESTRNMLSFKWGINCPVDCLCRNEEYLRNVEYARALDSQIFTFGSIGRMDKAYTCAERVIETR